MISSQNNCVFIRDLNDLTLQIIFDSWCASLNVGSKRSIAWTNSRHAPSWRFYLQWGIVETSGPGIIGILCHQVLRHPSEHGTNSMGKHLLPKAHMLRLNEFTKPEVNELTSSTIDEAALAILTRQGRRGTTIVSSQTKFIVDIDFWAILTVLTDKTLQTGSYGLCNCWISPRHLISLPHARIRFGSYSIDTYSTSAQSKLVRRPHANLPDTPVNFTIASKYFQMVPGPPGAKQSALRLCKFILTCSWKHRQLWRCIQDTTRFDL